MLDWGKLETILWKTWVSLRRSQVSILVWTVQPLHWAALLSNAQGKKKRVNFQTFITFFNLIFSLAWNLLQLTSYLYSFIANLTAPWSPFSPATLSAMPPLITEADRTVPFGITAARSSSPRVLSTLCSLSSGRLHVAFKVRVCF